MTTRAELLKIAKPILFSTEMVRAILEDRKTQTRWVIKLPDGMSGRPVGEAGNKQNPLGLICPCGIKRPRYQPDDILWVRESFCPRYFDDGSPAYKADYHKEKIGDVVPEPKWKPSIHMPKEAARIFLRMTDVQVERVQEISEEDAREEGYPFSYKTGCVIGDYMALWNSLNAKRGYGWDTNPWVWVYELERVIPEEDAA